MDIKSILNTDEPIDLSEMFCLSDERTSEIYESARMSLENSDKITDAIDWLLSTYHRPEEQLACIYSVGYLQGFGTAGCSWRIILGI